MYFIKYNSGFAHNNEMYDNSLEYDKFCDTSQIYINF